MIHANEIMLIDDDIAQLSNLKKRLTSLTRIAKITAVSFDDATNSLQHTTPDLVLLNHHLKNGQTNIEFVHEQLVSRNIPFVFISNVLDSNVLKEILPTKPIDFISQDVNDFELKKTIKMALLSSVNQTEGVHIDRYFFVKVGENIRKVEIDKVEMVEVEGKYLNIYVEDRHFVVKSSLNDFLKKLPPNFIKVHQSYIINLNFVVLIQLEEQIVKLENCEAKFSRNFKKSILHNKYFT